MKVAIQQPTYLPWAGYFALIDFVDEFVFLDSVQFDRRSWQQRNYIKYNDQKLLLTVPVKKKNNRFQIISNVKIEKNDYIKKHLRTIEQSYKKSKYFNLYFNELIKVYKTNFTKINELNQTLIKFFCKQIGVKIQFTLSSNLNINLQKEELIFEICKKRKCSNYISTIGSKKYLGNFKYFPKTKIPISYYEFNYTKYDQVGKKFINNLSIIDLLFNIGPETLDYLRKNFFVLNA